MACEETEENSNNEFMYIAFVYLIEFLFIKLITSLYHAGKWLFNQINNDISIN